MRFRLSMLVFSCFSAALQNAAGLADDVMQNLSIAQLEQRQGEIDEELQGLASYSMRSGVGTVGFRSKDYPDPHHMEWIHVELETQTDIDQIVLVPSIWRDTKLGFRADGFPVEFKVIAGTKLTTNVVASFTAEDNLLPRVAPVVVPFSTIQASWVRIEATGLSSRAWDGRYLLQFSEILVFSGRENVALHQSVTTSSIGQGAALARRRESLVDGFVPYLMDAAHGEQSIAFMSQAGIGVQPSLTIDMETIHPLNRIFLHTPELSDTVPQSSEPGHGIPRRLIVEGATLPDFSDAIQLTGYRMNSIFDSGPIIMLNFPETACRYVRLTASDPYRVSDQEGRTQIGFAEIELISGGRNVALGKPVTANFAAGSDRSFSSLTDGRNLYGTILPIREWMNQLARRHELERERPIIANELHRRYERQKVNLRRTSWLAALLAAGIAFTILIDRILRMQQVATIRERFAADLHDELGANIHTIGLLGDVALKSIETPDRLRVILQRNRELTERTGTAVRHCINLQEANGLFGNLRDDMHRAAQRILADMNYDISIEGEEFLEKLSPGYRTDLFLFFKECLVNISRHAEATYFSCTLKAERNRILLSITDNGKGLSEIENNQVPSSLRRRAHLLAARVTTETCETGGTRITLKFNPRKFRIIR